MELTELVGSEAPFPSPEGRESLVELSITCDELIEHFMDEEGALFRLVRDHIPEQADAVDRLEAEHDTIWGAVIRPTASCGARLEATCDAQMAFARFERLYTAHARAKIELIDALMGVLDFAQRALVAARSSGLS